ncbi:toll/interleukin-1 receptor domain-containing protein [Streptomyces yangpuensis]|uniref:toll/interleukin-1 receptor domain-containing protein n=1 Tax=Streptomyces yangpuensis TaxID=1648182 RepID=UPI00382798E7
METDGRPPPPIAADPPFDPDGPPRYDAFISYSWTDAKAHATAVNEALRSLARPAEQIRALEVFLDRSAMRVSPELWPEVAGHLDASRHLVLLLSPAATERRSWVSLEVQRWLATKGAGELTLVLVAGSAVWDAARHDFDHGAKDNAVPPALWGALGARPRIIDLTAFRTEAELDLSHPPFRARCLELAAAVHGEEPAVLEALEHHERASERRRRRRTRSVSGFTTAALVLTGLVAVGGAVYSGIKLKQTGASERTARERQVRAEADGLAARATGSAAPDLRLLLAAQAAHVSATAEALHVLRESVADDVEAYLHPGTQPVRDVALSANGTRVATVSGDGEVGAWDTGTHRRLFGPLRLDAYAVEWSDDGTLLIVASRDGTLRFLRDSGETVGQPAQGRAAPGGLIALSGDASRYALAPPEGPVTVWDRTGGTPVATVPRPEGRMQLVFASPDALVVGSSLVALPGGRSSPVPPTTGPPCSQLVQDVYGPHAYDAGYGRFVFGEEHDLFLQEHPRAFGGLEEAPEFRCAYRAKRLKLTLAGRAVAVDVASTGLAAAGTSTGLVVLARSARAAPPDGTPATGLIEAACAKAGRSLTQEEWRAALPDRAYAPVCRSVP